MDWKLEVVVVPVTDVDRASASTASRSGFAVDHDTRVSDDLARRSADPSGSACSIAVRQGDRRDGPSSVQGLQLVVPDIQAARAQLAERGVAVSQVQHYEGSDPASTAPAAAGTPSCSSATPTATAGTVQERPATA